ncbi:SHOCT domain-containing protein [endosymbiont 'TC1' of Trimyema compressum]|uniref:SHOCT domain-containing protein n=1 Tax=endosymbiont 'TC1' of Trimyema compressum TaxID=243899 RepID=UPI001FE0C874|nr:SHOCT domain-containing protein [endosymbiont 'TC1' of Trimyema compressum]
MYTKKHNDLVGKIKQKLEELMTCKKSNVTSGTVSVADEIRKYKLLCDEGIITEDEFDAKKKQLLG